MVRVVRTLPASHSRTNSARYRSSSLMVDTKILSKYSNTKSLSISYIALYDLIPQNFIEHLGTPTIERRIPYFTVKLPHTMNLAQIWDMMEHITDGLKFKHRNNEVNRDLSPTNGGSFFEKSTNDKHLIPAVNLLGKFQISGLPQKGRR
jgi:serine/threonine protein kinase